MGKIIKLIIIPCLTFILGIILQTILQGWLEKKDTILLSMIILICSVVVITIILSYVIHIIENRFKFVDDMLVDVSKRAGLLVEYIEDGNSGKSYKKTTELIKNAQDSLTFVDFWVPYQNYQTQIQDVLDVRSQYYNAILAQIESHKNDTKTFHRRIVQVPSNLMNSHIPFETDPAFQKYLQFCEKMQSQFPNSCRIKIANSHIRIPFIMVDQRYVVLPILTSDSNSQSQTRHGAFFFDDRQGNLITCLKKIYNTIDAQANPLTNNLLINMNENSTMEKDLS